MNMLKFIALAIIGLGVGFGTSQVLANNDVPPLDTEEDTWYGCHMDSDEFMEHYIEQFNDEDQALIYTYIDTLLVEYDVTLEDVIDDYSLRHEFMELIFEYVEDNALEPDDSGYYHHPHMGW